MGCFNKQGFISSLPISYGDETVLIFLNPNQYTDSRLGGVTYSTDLFAPIFLPIFGEYNDYGAIENIKKTDSVKYIEDFFGINIETVISEIDNNSMGRHGCTLSATKNEDVYDRLTFGLEHKSVFEKMSEVKKFAYVEDYLYPYWLLKLGFIDNGYNTTDDRYKKTWSHPDLIDYAYNSDDTWGYFIDPNGTVVRDVYHVDDMERYILSINPNYKSTLTQLDRRICKFDLILVNSKLALLEYESKKSDDPIVEYRRTMFGVPKYLGYPKMDSSYEHFAGSVDTGTPIELNNSINNKEICDMIRFNATITDLSAKYQPSNYGSQDDSIMTHYELLKCYKKILINKMKDRNDDGDYDEIISDIIIEERSELVDEILK